MSRSSSKNNEIDVMRKLSRKKTKMSSLFKGNGWTEDKIGRGTDVIVISDDELEGSSKMCKELDILCIEDLEMKNAVRSKSTSPSTGKGKVIQTVVIDDDSDESILADANDSLNGYDSTDSSSSTEGIDFKDGNDCTDGNNAKDEHDSAGFSKNGPIECNEIEESDGIVETDGSDVIEIERESSRLSGILDEKEKKEMNISTDLFENENLKDRKRNLESFNSVKNDFWHENRSRYEKESEWMQGKTGKLALKKIGKEQGKFISVENDGIDCRIVYEADVENYLNGQTSSSNIDKGKCLRKKSDMIFPDVKSSEVCGFDSGLVYKKMNNNDQENMEICQNHEIKSLVNNVKREQATYLKKRSVIDEKSSLEESRLSACEVLLSPCYDIRSKGENVKSRIKRNIMRVLDKGDEEIINAPSKSDKEMPVAFFCSNLRNDDSDSRSSDLSFTSELEKIDETDEENCFKHEMGKNEIIGLGNVALEACYCQHPSMLRVELMNKIKNDIVMEEKQDDNGRVENRYNFMNNIQLGEGEKSKECGTYISKNIGEASEEVSTMKRTHNLRYSPSSTFVTYNVDEAMSVSDEIVNFNCKNIARRYEGSSLRHLSLSKNEGGTHWEDSEEKISFPMEGGTEFVRKRGSFDDAIGLVKDCFVKVARVNIDGCNTSNDPIFNSMKRKRKSTVFYCAEEVEKESKRQKGIKFKVKKKKKKTLERNFEKALNYINRRVVNQNSLMSLLAWENSE